MSKPKSLGDVVLALRTSYGITRVRLEEAAKLQPGTVRRVEQGKLWPSWGMLERLCAHPSMRALIETCVRYGVELGVRPPPKPQG
jgi:transcriptional regulator with XRE-family HTH domain